VVTSIAPLLCISGRSTSARAKGRWVQGNVAWPLRYHVDQLTTQLRGGAITSAHTSSPSLFAALSWLARESGGEKWPDQPFASSPVSARIARGPRELRLAKCRHVWQCPRHRLVCSHSACKTVPTTRLHMPTSLAPLSHLIGAGRNMSGDTGALLPIACRHARERCQCTPV
jgi:hypothetical protein